MSQPVYENAFLCPFHETLVVPLGPLSLTRTVVPLLRVLMRLSLLKAQHPAIPRLLHSAYSSSFFHLVSTRTIGWQSTSHLQGSPPLLPRFLLPFLLLFFLLLLRVGGGVHTSTTRPRYAQYNPHPLFFHAMQILAEEREFVLYFGLKHFTGHFNSVRRTELLWLWRLGAYSDVVASTVSMPLFSPQSFAVL